ncbi:MAG TPA: hypothetical protein VMV86_01170, partial [Methanosarcinales archaeon]|nr:hypothetical protein [Methanosarcinales archaeon]
VPLKSNTPSVTPTPKQSIKPIPKMTPAQKKVYAEELGLSPKEPLVIRKSPSKQLVVGKGVKKNVIPQGKLAPKDLKRVDNPFAPLLVNALNTASLGLLERNNNAIDTLRQEHPIQSTLGSMAGYIAPFSAARGALIKGTQTLGKRMLTDAGIGAGMDAVIEGNRMLDNKQNLKGAVGNVALGALFGIAADGALEGLGMLGKTIAKKIKAGEILSKAEMSAIDTFPKQAKQEIVNAIKKPKANKYSTMTKQVSQNKPDAYLDDYLDTIGAYEKEWLHPTKTTEMQPIESVVNKVSTVRGKDPSSKYFRFTQKDEPMSNWGHAMFSDDISKVSSDGITSSSYGDHGWSYDGKDAVHIDKLKSKIKKAWEHDIKNGFSGDFAGNTIGDDAYQNMSWEEVYNSFNPDNIVDFADGYDNELNQWLWERIIEPNDIKAIKTSDGAVVFNNDDSIIKKLADSQRQFTPSTTTQKGLQQVQKQLPTPTLKYEGKNLPSITQPQTLRIKKPIEAPKPLSNINTQPIVKSGLKPNVDAQEIAATVMKEPKNEKLLSFAQTMKKSDNTATELKQLIKDNPLSYKPINNPDTLKYAKEIVDENFDAAKALVKQGDSFANATEATMAQDVIRRMQQEASTNPAKWDEVFEIMEVTANKYKKAGQTVQTASMWSRMTPDGMLNYAQRAVNQANYILPAGKKIKLDAKLAERITETMTQIQKAPEQVLDLIKKQTGELPKWADDILLSKSNDQLKDVAIAQVLSDIGNQVPSNIWKKVSTAQALSHLLNVKTISRNILGNTGFGVVENISNVLAVPVDKMLAKATGKRSLALPQLKGSFKAGIDRAKESALDIKLGINRSGVAEGKYNITTGQSFKGGIGAAGEKALKYSLVVPDEFAKGQIYDNVLKQQMKAGKVTTPTKEMVEYANQRALYGTFQDESLPATIMQGAKDLLNKLGGGNKVRGGSGLMTREFGAGDLMIKYTKVPGNIISRTVEYTPMGLLKLLSIGKNAKIANKQAEMAMTIGRAATGTMMIGLGAALKNAGLLVGEDKDRSTKALTLDRAEGLGNYSVNISALNRIIAGGNSTPQKGDELYSYGWLEPVSKSLAIGAAVATEMSKDTTASEKAYKVASNTVDELLDISTLFVIRKMTYQDNVFDVMLTPVTESVSGFVPSPIRQLAQTLDPTARETKASTPAGTALNKVKANIPGLRQTLEPRISPFGQEVKYPGGVVQNMINPGQKSIYNPSEITDKLKRLEDLTGLSIQYPSTSAPKQVTSKKQPFALTPKDKTNYQKFAGQETEKVYKQILANKDIENMSEAQLEALVKQLQSANLKSRERAKLDFLRK